MPCCGHNKTARDAGVGGTPFFMLARSEPNGSKVRVLGSLVGAQPFPAFKAQIDRLLAEQPLAPVLRIIKSYRSVDACRSFTSPHRHRAETGRGQNYNRVLCRLKFWHQFFLLAGAAAGQMSTQPRGLKADIVMMGKVNVGASFNHGIEGHVTNRLASQKAKQPNSRIQIPVVKRSYLYSRRNRTNRLAGASPSASQGSALCRTRIRIVTCNRANARRHWLALLFRRTHRGRASGRRRGDRPIDFCAGGMPAFGVRRCVPSYVYCLHHPRHGPRSPCMDASPRPGSRMNLCPSSVAPSFGNRTASVRFILDVFRVGECARGNLRDFPDSRYRREPPFQKRLSGRRCPRGRPFPRTPFARLWSQNIRAVPR